MSARPSMKNDRLRQARLCKGWKQEQVAEKLGITFETVSRWERGEAFPSPLLREKLSRLFGMPLEALGLVQLVEASSSLSSAMALVSASAEVDRAQLRQYDADLYTRGLAIWSMSSLKQLDSMQKRAALQEAIRVTELVVLFVSPASRSSRDVRIALEQAALYRRPVCAIWTSGASWQTCFPEEYGQPLTIIDGRSGPAETILDELLEVYQRVHLVSNEVPEAVDLALSSAHGPAPEAFSSEYRQRQDLDWERMLRRLQRSYKELLDQSLHGIAWIDLGFSSRSDLVSNVTNLLFHLSQDGERPLASGTTVLDAYDEAAEELLILGAPGAGKSTLLLSLAQQLVERAFVDALQPLPVILRLSSWSTRQLALIDWMIEQFSCTYDVPLRLCERWVKQGRILPLLDGLDEVEEVARSACIAAINHYHHLYLTPLVICSRQAEYESASRRECLALQCAVIIQPLSAEQIEHTLQAIGPSFTGIKTAMHQRLALWELATTPLMLSVLLLTYKGSLMDDILKQERDLERQIWADYVDRMVREKGDVARYPLERIYLWLSWLAKQMRMHQQTTFYAEQLHIDWLAGVYQRRVAQFMTFVPSTMIGMCVCIFASVFIIGVINMPMLFLLGIFGGFAGGCLGLTVAGKPPVIGVLGEARIVRPFRNAVLLGMLIVTCIGLFFGAYSPVNIWLSAGSVLALGSLISAWIFQIVLIGRLSGKRASTPQKLLTPRDRLAALMTARVPLYIWQAAAAFGIGIGLSCGFGVGMAAGFKDGTSVMPMLGEGLGTGLTFGLGISVTVVFAYIVLETSLWTLHFAECVHWTWFHLFRSGHLRTVMIVIGGIFFFFLLDDGLSVGIAHSMDAGLGAGLIYGLSAGLGTGLSVGLMYWLVIGFYRGMKQERLDDQKRSRFNQGIQRSLRNSFLMSLISSIMISFLALLDTWLSNCLINWLNKSLHTGLHQGLSNGLSEVLIVLVTGMIIMWALFGGLTVLRHYVILWSLARQGIFPWRAASFLDDATTRILLRRVGGGYSFIHRRLQDYFAEIGVPPSQN